MEEFFDASFLAELEGLVAEAPGAGARIAPAPELRAPLDAFLAPPPDAPADEALDERGFQSLAPAVLAERTNALIENCRRSPRRGALEAVESFVVFFQALMPTLDPDGEKAIRSVFFRLVPILVHIAWNDFARDEPGRREGRAALRQLESVLIEISSVRLAPSEAQLVFKSIDQMTAFIAAGEYALATEIISSRLLSLIARNRLTRALFRLMEVEVRIQRYLKERRGYPTPQIRLPEDFSALSDYGPVRLFREEGAGGEVKRLIQVQLPDIAILRDIVLHLEREGSAQVFDLRLDALGSAELPVSDGTYRIGLAYQPEEAAAR